MNNQVKRNYLEINSITELVEAKKVWNFKVKLVKNNILLDKSGGVTLLISEVKKNK